MIDRFTHAIRRLIVLIMLACAHAIVVPALHATSITCYFSPDDHIHEKIVALIKAETKSIKVAIYQLTDKRLAQALIDAHNRGVIVELVIDPSTIRSMFGKIGMLKTSGIAIFEYDPRNELYNLMHHKFALFEGGGVVVTGSFNWTKSADAKNQENVVFIADAEIIKRYSDQFKILKTRCVTV